MVPDTLYLIMATAADRPVCLPEPLRADVRIESSLRPMPVHSSIGSTLVSKAADLWVLEGTWPELQSLWLLADCEACWMSLPKWG